MHLLDQELPRDNIIQMN